MTPNILGLLQGFCVWSQKNLSSPSTGVVDKLFARIGASDNVANRQSTFHVEMKETAHILNNATPSSFVILDEIGVVIGAIDFLFKKIIKINDLLL